jgi:prepilin-type N-terminal cleavage/methylation domain-containing protein/prepilin-type processing-associated H-X9-DG protein
MRALQRNVTKIDRGFTLVELLVVIAIIGVLVALLLPAIQAAREAARRSQCANNLKQLGLAVQMHHDAKKAFPTGRNATDTRSVSWAYYLLPYMEQQAMFTAYQKGLEVHELGNAMTFRTPVPTMFCPSRRAPAADSDFDNNDGLATVDPEAAGKAAPGDYAANAGDEDFNGDAERLPSGLGAVGDQFDPVDTGPIFTRSKINERQVTDGLSNTFVIGEKYIAVEVEEGITPPAEGLEDAFFGDSAIFSGDSRQTIMRATDDGFPSQLPDDDDNKRFGSDHSQQCHFAFLDGSVRPINYTIEIGILEALSCIGDDVVIPGTY